MGNIVLNVDTKVAFYFGNHTRLELNQLIQQHGSVLEAANLIEPTTPVQLVVDIITNADHIQPPQVNSFYGSGNPVLEFDFTGFQPTYRTIRQTIPIDLKKVTTAFLSTDVIFRDNQVPVEDVNPNNTTVVPADENNVAGKANDE